METIIQKQLQFMEDMGYIINKQPGLTCETVGWEKKIYSTVVDLNNAAVCLHQTLSAEAVAKVLCEGVTLIYCVTGLLNNIGVGDRVPEAMDKILEALRTNSPRPNLLPLVIDKS